ncbi:CAP domain-containing protein [Kickxella alabastrina]|uniref:CAP domain-containing protein n=1 Tax=Kickxella alabastrina TaxID=61397 RepID=UPI00221FA7CE|nr:CAP domain-containing protein [Kickxella alabastrina]KAI7834401.1 CAP domain-containing protein [Kickxella alabastrina]
MRPALQARNLKRETRAISNEWRQEMLVILNNLRAQAGGQPVELRDEINNMAQKHSEYQAHANVMTHKDPSGSLGDRGSASGIKWAGISENVAFGSQTVEDVMKMWVSSPPHYANMLGNYSLVGFGLASNNTISKYDIYWTQNFILPR